MTDCRQFTPEQVQVELRRQDRHILNPLLGVLGVFVVVWMAVHDLWWLGLPVGGLVGLAVLIRGR